MRKSLARAFVAGLLVVGQRTVKPTFRCYRPRSSGWLIAYWRRPTGTLISTLRH